MILNCENDDSFVIYISYHLRIRKCMLAKYIFILPGTLTWEGYFFLLACIKLSLQKKISVLYTRDLTIFVTEINLKKRVRYDNLDIFPKVFQKKHLKCIQISALITYEIHDDKKFKKFNLNCLCTHQVIFFHISFWHEPHRSNFLIISI